MKVEDLKVGTEYKIGNRHGKFVEMRGKVAVLNHNGQEVYANPNDGIKLLEKAAEQPKYSNMQICKGCRQRKPLTEFRRTRGDGIGKTCKTCLARNILAGRVANGTKTGPKGPRNKENAHEETVEHNSLEKKVEMSVGTENFVDALRGEYGKDMVKNPGHYIGVKGLEVREVEENFLPKFQDGHLAHLAGAALEYLLRAPSKHRLVEDLEKLHYLAGEMVAYAKTKN